VSQISLDYDQILADLIVRESGNLTDDQLYTLFLQTQSPSDALFLELLSSFNFTQLVLTYDLIQESTNSDLESLFA
jgi:hypothetical protein